MRRFLPLYIFILSLLLSPLLSYSQEKSSDAFPDDSTLMHASISMYVENIVTGKTVMEFNSGNSLAPASVMKVITSAVALEMLGPEYTFKTKVGYTGTLNKRTGKLKGDIIITGGGDPTLGSEYFTSHYHDFISSWVNEIYKAGIRNISGRVITDDSYYDYQPVPGKWLLEDEGNYYGAGVFGLSLFDNTYEIHLKSSSDTSRPIIQSIVPEECRTEIVNYLTSSGSSDDWCVYSSPYSKTCRITGKIPENRNDFVINASINDPPLVAASLLTSKLKARGIKISENPTTVRIEKKSVTDKVIPVTETLSPLLTDIIEVLNHESVNLYAENLLKELGRKFRNNGSTSAGIEVVDEFLKKSGINTNGFFIVDGSGLSPQNAVNTAEIVHLLVYMKNRSKYFSQYYSSFPDAGKNGTLKNSFKEPVFISRLKAKSGSMTRVRSFAGYFTTLSGKNMAFSIIINNYSGPSAKVISGIEEIISELISEN